MNENGFRFNRGKEGDLAWRPRDYNEEDYREDNSRHIDYGERYGAAAYGKAHYDPNANRDFVDPRGNRPEPRYNYTWSNDEPFNNREQDYRYHPERYPNERYSNERNRNGSSADQRATTTERNGSGIPSGMEQFGGNTNLRQSGDYRGRGPKNYKRSDERIREEVSERLTHDADVDPSDVEVVVTNGEVFLRGTISDRPMKRRAEDIAEMVMGVSDVHNELRLSSLAMTSGSGASTSDSTSDGRQHSVAQTEGARGGSKQTKTPHSGG
jgi:hypothetical protein